MAISYRKERYKVMEDEEENLDWLRNISMDSMAFQNFPMENDRRGFAPVQHGFSFSGVPKVFPPEISPYNNHFIAGDSRGIRNNYYDSAASFYDFQLESEFKRLGLFDTSSYPSPYPPVYGGVPTSGSGSVSNIRNNFSGPSHPQFSGNNIQRMRSQSAAREQMELQTQFRNSNGFFLSGGVNPHSDYGLTGVYDSPRWNLDAAAAATAIGYCPPTMNQNGSASDFLYRSGREPNPINSKASVLPERPIRSRSRQNYSSLQELRGRIFSVSKDQAGCRFLQDKFKEGNPDDIRMIFAEVKDHVCELMIDQFGNYLVQKLFDVVNLDQMTQLLLIVLKDERRFKDICLDAHGTRAIQNMVEHLKTADQRSLMLSVLRRVTVALTTSPNGHHVVQQCLKCFSVEENKQLLNVVADNCLDVATDKSGCCVLQQCLAHARGEPKERLISEITMNALILAEHPYGNYVVQYVIGVRCREVTTAVLAQLSGHFVSLSLNKYGSNVVEKCLRETDGDHVLKIIDEIISSPNFVRVLQDPYGNYVGQSLLDNSKGEMHKTIDALINLSYSCLHSHPHGKRVLVRTEGYKAGGKVRTPDLPLDLSV